MPQFLLGFFTEARGSQFGDVADFEQRIDAAQLLKFPLMQHGDPIAHGEMSAMRAAGRQKSYRDTTLYTTLAPCAMCTGALFWAGVQRVVFAATQADIIAALGGPALPIRTAEAQ